MNIEIKGSCVTREAINYWNLVHPEMEELDVVNYLFQKPIAVLSSSIINEENETISKIERKLISNGSVRDFVVRQLRTSFDKKIKSKSFKEEYFFFDLIDERMSLIEYKNSFIEYRNEIWEELEVKGAKKVVNDYDVFINYFDKFINKIRERYSDEKIILHKAYAVYDTKVRDKEYLLIDTVDEENKNYESYSVEGAMNRNNILTKFYDYIEEKYPNIKVIELSIEDYYSSIDHRYGRGYYHYNDNYYIDFVNKFNDILNDKYNLEENRRIKEKNKSWISKINTKLKLFQEENNNIEVLQSRINNQVEMFNNYIKSFYSNDEIIYRDDLGRISMIINYYKGIVESRRIYSNGKLSVYSFFNEFGTMIEERRYRNGCIYQIDNMNKDGLLIRSRHYSNRKLIKDIAYGDYKKIGQVISCSEYNIDGRKIGFTMFYGNGKIRTKTLYLDNNIYDRTEIYESNGNLKEVRRYYSTNIRKNTILYTKGKKRKEINYFSNGSIKEIVTFSSSNEVSSRMYRKNDKQNFIKE